MCFILNLTFVLLLTAGRTFYLFRYKNDLIWTEFSTGNGLQGTSFIGSMTVKNADVSWTSSCRLDWSHSRHRCAGAKGLSCLFLFSHIFHLTAPQHQLSFITCRSVVLGSFRKNSLIRGCLLIISAHIWYWEASNLLLHMDKAALHK